MRSRNAGRIGDRLWYLGREESGIYLLEGTECSVIVSGGMSYLAPVVLSQMRAFGIDEKRIRKLIILHAHFDHVGLVPFFKRRYPELEIYASSRAWEILKMSKGIDTINTFSRVVAERMGMAGCLDEGDLEWRDDIEGKAIFEEGRIELGNLSIRVLETPGHSSCSITAYVPEMTTLFPSDGGGIPYRDMIMPAGNSNYSRYQQSLEKLKSLKVSLVCADHYGYVLGEEANDYIGRSIEAARERRTVIESLYRQTGSIDDTVDALVKELYTQYPGYFLSPEIYAGVYRQTVRHIANCLEKQKA